MCVALSAVSSCVQCVAMCCVQNTFLLICLLLSCTGVLHIVFVTLFSLTVEHKTAEIALSSVNYNHNENTKCVLRLNQRADLKGTHFSERVKTILYWNKLHNDSFAELNIGEEPSTIACSVDCLATTSRNCDVEDFDAVIFNMFSFPDKTYVIRHGEHEVLSEDIPLKRKPHQRYVFFMMEPPGEFSSNLKRFDHYFNWTMTYRMASDVFFPYGYLTNTSTPPRYSDGPPVYPMVWREPDVPPREWIAAISDTVRRKTKLVAWFVSKCDTSSERELYVQELGQFIDVDIYGSCGDFACKGRSECYQMLEKEYKFYLSFERALWEDFVTEELFAAMELLVVPVVYGAANYSAVAPPGSYIDVRDFDSPRHLAQYLWHLDDHHEEYTRFFWWKRYYAVRQENDHALCKLCEMLNQRDLPKQSYSNISEWFSGESKHHTPNELFTK